MTTSPTSSQDIATPPAALTGLPTPPTTPKAATSQAIQYDSPPPMKATEHATYDTSTGTWKVSDFVAQAIKESEANQREQTKAALRLFGDSPEEAAAKVEANPNLRVGVVSVPIAVVRSALEGELN